MHLRVCAAVLQLSVCFLGSVSDAVSVTSEGCSSSCFLFDVEMLGCSYSEQTAGAELGHHKESHHAMISTSQKIVRDNTHSVTNKMIVLVAFFKLL